MAAIKKRAEDKCDSYVLARVTKNRHRKYNQAARAERKSLAEVIRTLLDEWLKKREEKAA